MRWSIISKVVVLRFCSVKTLSRRAFQTWFTVFFFPLLVAAWTWNLFYYSEKAVPRVISAIHWSNIKSRGKVSFYAMLLSTEPFSHVCLLCRGPHVFRTEKNGSHALSYIDSAGVNEPPVRSSHPLVRSVLVIRLYYAENLYPSSLSSF